VTVGRQGINVALRSTNVSWDVGTDILSADVTVQNLSDLALGTLDGTTLASGVSVFFVSGPSGPLGETVDLPNVDGTNTFTASGQPFFHYAEVLAPQAISSSKTWQFHLNGVASFTFSVLVSADAPSAQGFLSWSTDPLLGKLNWQGITGWGGSGLAIFGQYGVISVFDNGIWNSRSDPTGLESSTYGNQAVAGSGPSRLFTVLSDGSTIRFWDGISWRTINSLPGGPSAHFTDIHLLGDDTLFATGDSVWRFVVGSAAGGGSWNTLTNPTTGPNACKAATVAVGRIFCVFGNSEVYSWNGSSWLFNGNSHVASPTLIFAHDTSDLWVYSSLSPNDFGHYSGGTWAAPILPEPAYQVALLHANMLADGEVFAVGISLNFPNAGIIWHWDGATWNEEFYNTDFYPRDVWARDADTAYAVGTENVILKRTGGTWNFVSGIGGPPQSNPWSSAYVAGSNDIFLGAAGQRIAHWNGTAWTFQTTPVVSNIRTLWGSSGSNVYVGGTDCAIDHYNGSSWSAEPDFASVGVFGLGGSGASNVWAVGYDCGTGNTARFDGTSWIGASTPDDGILFAVWSPGPGFAIAVGQGGKISRWDGASWSTDASPTGSDLLAVWGSSTSDIWAVGNGGTIIHWDGSAWGSGGTSCGGGGFQLDAVWGRSSTEVYAADNGGSLCFYDGTSWTAVPVQSAGSGPIYAISGDTAGQTAVAVGTQVYRGSR
jgi:hypothetical protein